MSCPPQEQKFLNLAHQFLDTNFIEAKKTNNFNILPVISTNPDNESFVRPEPPMAVDYFSYDLTAKQYHNCWKNISNNQFMKPYELSNVDNVTRLKTVQPTDDLMMFLPTTSQARLENACWRAWSKKLYRLKELDPSEINWFKENDVTVLYGPLITDEKELESTPKSFSPMNIEINMFTNVSNKIEDSTWSNEYITSSSLSPNLEELTFSSESESDSDSIMFQRRYSVESTRTSISANSVKSNTKLNNTIFENSYVSHTHLKSILKKRKTTPLKDSKPKKRITFSSELDSVRFIVS